MVKSLGYDGRNMEKNVTEGPLEIVVAQWLAHLPLVLEAPGSIPARGEENFGVQTRFL